MTVMNLDKLEVWVRAKDFALAVYKDVIHHLPPDEKWNLTQQLKRAAQSIPANIAEGHGRYHFLDNVRFCYIARGHWLKFKATWLLPMIWAICLMRFINV